jgi:hypothetical protein
MPDPRSNVSLVEDRDAVQTVEEEFLALGTAAIGRPAGPAGNALHRGLGPVEAGRMPEVRK